MTTQMHKNHTRGQKSTHKQRKKGGNKTTSLKILVKKKKDIQFIAN